MEKDISFSALIKSLIQSLMFWGCITYDGTGSLIECSNTMNSNEYIDVLDNANIKLLSDFGLKFEQDNAPIHKSAKCKIMATR